MIVVITSCAPTVARRIPAMPAKRAPASIAARIAKIWCSGPAMSANDEPTQTAMIEPTMYWPWPPMLKRPQRNANATASPVRMYAVVSEQRLLEVQRRREPLVARDPREEPVEAVPSKIAL